MRNINKLWLVLLAVTFLLQTSCTREAFIQREENQIVGDWYFYRVRVTSFFNVDNVTNNFRDASITFNEDYTVSYVQDNGDLLEGNWTYNIIDGGEESSNQLVLQLENTNTGEESLLLWDDFSVTNRRMWGQEDFDDRSQMHYQLRRF